MVAMVFGLRHCMLALTTVGGRKHAKLYRIIKMKIS